MFQEKPSTEDVTEMTLPVVNGTFVSNPGKIIASSCAERAASMIHQPPPFTVQIKPEDVPMPGVVSEPVFTFPDVFMLPTNKVEDNLIEPQQILMPTTVEESNNIILAEPTVVPNFNRCVSFIGHTDVRGLARFYFYYVAVCLSFISFTHFSSLFNYFERFI